MENGYVMPSHCTPARAHSLDIPPQYPITTCGVQCNTNATAGKQIKESTKNEAKPKQQTNEQTNKQATSKQTNEQTNQQQTKKQINTQPTNKQTRNNH